MRLRQLRIIRIQNGLTQQQIADVLGISRSAYCSYETGRRSPNLDIIERLSEFYQIPVETIVGKIVVDYFFEDSYYEGQEDTRYLSQLSRQEREIIVNFRRLNKKDKAEVAKYLKEKLAEKGNYDK
ncbi:MAG: helix-turn-helix transcriptional regulator [Oscillospiraceae bacterium]|nr:helix-turn-helix transcriptional regulator [Oscillospiraceae bacterium]